MWRRNLPTPAKDNEGSCLGSYLRQVHGAPGAPRFCRASSIGTPSSSSTLHNQKCLQSYCLVALGGFPPGCTIPTPRAGLSDAGLAKQPPPACPRGPALPLTHHPEHQPRSQFCHFTLSRVQIWVALGHAEDAEPK